MFRKRMVMAAGATAAGVLLLTACGHSGSGSAAGAAPSVSASAAAGGAAAAADNPLLQDLTTFLGTAKQHNAPANTGDFADKPGEPATEAGRAWTQLSASRAGELDPVVVNGLGFTLYRFDGDTSNPSKSNCTGACATTWLPVVLKPGGKVFLDGVKSSALGAIRRDDGTLQVTLDGFPVYRFSGDQAPGDTNGEGVDGKWFGITPDGGKAGAPTAVGSGGSSAGTGRPATNAVLFDDSDFADNGSQGVSGHGCQDVSRPDVASSIQADGSLTVWSGKDCSGRSAVVNGNVSDLSSLGFDNAIASVTLG